MPADPSTRPHVDYYFGPYRFDGKLRRLYKDEKAAVLTPKAADTLLALLERAGRVIEKDELFRAVWGDIVVGDDTLAQNISALRRVLGDDANRPRFIATVPRHGYRFVASVRTAPQDTAARASEAAIENPFNPAYPIARVDSTRRWLALIGVTALVAAFGGFLAQRLFVRDHPSSVVQFTINEPDQWRFAVSGGMLAVSPNGEHLSFIAVDVDGSSSLWLRPFASAVSRLMDGTEGATNPFWSPDSRTIAFFADRRLKAIDVMSGAVRVIATLSSPRSVGATWSRNGEILFSVPHDGMYLVPASGGIPRPLAPPLDTGCCGAWPNFLPDGRRFLYTVAGPDTSAPGIYVGEIGSPRGRRLLDDISSSTYISPGFLSFLRSGTLYLQRVDTRRMQLTGAPVPLSDSVAYNARTGRVLTATSDTGVIALRKPPLTELVWVDRAGRSDSVAAPSALYFKFSIAPDGKRAAAARLDPRTGTSDVWVFDEGREVRVTENPHWDSDPIWSEDGRYVVYGSRRGNRWQIYRRLATAVGAEELLLDYRQAGNSPPSSALQRDCLRCAANRAVV